ncbi:MAG: FliM/FliN family flagellar motor switch protein [Sphingomonadaceae bacterium]|nr:FliM/FliN family flagellar motor switch protein [Sphingomonadaceae bacterium]
MTSNSSTLGLIGEVMVSLSVELGRTEMALRDVLALGEESVVPLDRLTDEPLDVLVNGKAIAKAEIVTENNRFVLRIVELVGGPRAADGTVAEAA